MRYNNNNYFNLGEGGEGGEETKEATEAAERAIESQNEGEAVAAKAEAEAEEGQREIVEKTQNDRIENQKKKTREVIGKLFGGDSGNFKPIDATMAVDILGNNTDAESIKITMGETQYNLTDTEKLSALLKKFPDSKRLADKIVNLSASDKLYILSEMSSVIGDFQVTATNADYDDGIQSSGNHIKRVSSNIEKLFSDSGSSSAERPYTAPDGTVFNISEQGITSDGKQIYTESQLNEFTNLVKDHKNALDAFKEAIENSENSKNTKDLNALADATERLAEAQKKLTDAMPSFRDAHPYLFFILFSLVLGGLGVVANILYYIFMGQAEQANMQGCYLLTANSQLINPKSKCMQANGKIDPANNKNNCQKGSECCNNAFNIEDGNININKYFGKNDSAPSYWLSKKKKQINPTSDFVRNVKVTSLPAFNRNQFLRVDTVNSLNNALSSNGENIAGSPLPIDYSTDGADGGYVTYAIRSVSLSSAITNIKCKENYDRDQKTDSWVKAILYVGGSIVLLFVIFYFVKFEYDKHDGKVKAKYRK